ncbi:glycosyltransferase, partial [Streptomyces sparsogenes]
MRVLIVTAGSRGDVAPFTGLGRRLLDAGHEVAVAAHPPFAGLVAGCGLDHRPLPGDPRELIRARAGAASPEEAREVTRAFLERLADGVVA